MPASKDRTKTSLNINLLKDKIISLLFNSKLIRYHVQSEGKFLLGSKCKLEEFIYELFNIKLQGNCILLFHIQSMVSGDFQLLFYSSHMPGCAVLANSLDYKCCFIYLMTTGLSILVP